MQPMVLAGGGVEPRVRARLRMAGKTAQHRALLYSIRSRRMHRKRRTEPAMVALQPNHVDGDRLGVAVVLVAEAGKLGAEHVPSVVREQDGEV